MQSTSRLEGYYRAYRIKGQFKQEDSTMDFKGYPAYQEFFPAQKSPTKPAKYAPYISQSLTVPKSSHLIR